MQLWQFLTIAFLIVGFGIAAVIAAYRASCRGLTEEQVSRLLETNLRQLEEKLQYGDRAVAENVEKGMRNMAELIKAQQETSSREMIARQDALYKVVGTNSTQSEERFKTFETATARELAEMRATLERQLKSLSDDNSRRLDEMRNVIDKRLDDVKGVVDEKLQKTLNERINESFKAVSERLEEVYRGLGEMKTLANGVGDLKKVLTNVKSRGTLGEIQLGAILEDILTPDQYVKNFDAKQRSNERVEYAIRLPNDGETPVYLPIDSKFPMDAYAKLSDAYDSADTAAVAVAQRNLCDTITRFAKDIRDKYICPPRTTDFAIMFLPTEGIYAEVVRLGMVEKLQRECKVNIAGPSTMGALLNSLRMGFSNFAMQKRSAEAWRILSAVKTEFKTFEEVLNSAQKQINRANDELEKLIGTRTRQMMRKLKDVETMPSAEAIALLSDE